MGVVSGPKRVQVTWVRNGRLGSQAISHPWLWAWWDEEGYERLCGSGAEAVAAVEARRRELAAGS